MDISNTESGINLGTSTTTTDINFDDDKELDVDDNDTDLDDNGEGSDDDAEGDDDVIAELKKQLQERDKRLKEANESADKWRSRAKRGKKKARSMKSDPGEGYMTIEDVDRLLQEREFKKKHGDDIYSSVKEIASSKDISMNDAFAIYAFTNKDEYEQRARKFNSKSPTGSYGSVKQETIQDKKKLESFWRHNKMGKALQEKYGKKK